MRKELESIINDNTSGSEELTIKLAEYFESFLNEIKQPSVEIEKLEEEFQEFAGVKSFLISLKDKLENQSENSVKQFLASFKKQKTDAYQKIYNSAKTYLHNKRHILTISNSTTLVEILKIHYKNSQNLEVTISESRPMLEGRIMAQKLADEGISVNFITETALPKYVAGCDLVLLGADKILSNGDIVNKTGSLNLAILSEYYQKPLIVAASKSKFSNEFQFEENYKNPAEIWDSVHSKIKIFNSYFEEIPRKFITEIISDL